MTFFAISIGIIVLFAGVLIGYPWIIAAMIAIGVTIASAPGVLNLEVTILLTMAVKKLAKNKIICKNLHVIEELGSTSCLCTDKTGTITINKMTVSNFSFSNMKYKGQELLTSLSEIQRTKNFIELHKCAVLSSTAVFDVSPPILQLNKIMSRTDIHGEEK